MKRVAGILAVVLMASLLSTSDVRAGSAGAPAGKTTGSSVTATIVVDVTGQSFTLGKGLTSIRIQRSGSSAAALFDSSLINSWLPECSAVVGETDFRFVGKMNGWVPPGILTALFGTSGNSAVITDTDYPACTDVLSNGAGGGTRHVLSFTAVIQFEK